MSILKTYQQVNENQSKGFRISRMEDLYDKRDGKTDDPHRHDYYTVLFIKSARGVHKIDFNSFELEDQQIYFVAPGQVHQVIETKKSHGYVMTFSNQFLIENSINISFIQNLHLFNNYGYNPPLNTSDNEFKNLEEHLSKIYDLFLGNTKMKFLSIGSYLKIFLISCNNLCSLNPIDSSLDTSADQIILSFKNKVEKYYKIEHSTSYYADQLYITPDHLNRTVKAKIGKTAKEYIQARIATEAKRLLYFTNQTNKEIAYELGFNQPANFSAFFKKMTNVSPTQFKNDLKKS